ncbi:MAG: 30S ribosomal protein S16 [Candidatus Moranbacteria bacterium RIFOXYA12_FULL_35_19]|nr:MAG: 30S ribosomal protein S16 [Candidatus Moranbacteria bacterium GW2011_GWF2_35_39]OGI30128.1 MAG: 30S ribosomal protein S16 [Candidatus Moranbacteria bacterium RIFOXYB12_FULL_35_8]OGI33190.1 MAG: 30S ribosomal protein S16 [Candidatus Moranbacteria bacterium RIFOXYC12_FULL_36_13]OGI36648.1 MAG: 30S ribosomal protein S16 [Candidatus Moranbacteria bacterium RIFOXYA12_FULL_35_19]
MLTIRLARVGKVNKAQYKIVLQEKTVAPGGRHVEILGSYDPHSKKAVLKEEKIKYWISKGAQLSDTVHNLFSSKGLITEKKRVVKLPTKKAEEAPAGEIKTEEIKTQNSAEEKQNDTEKVEEAKVEEVKSETKIAEAPVVETKPEEVKVEEPPKTE